jgi:hypothetical protein
MATWPGEEIEERAGDIAPVAVELLSNQFGWRHRRVETLTVLSHEQVRRAVSVDFTVPADFRDALRISDAGGCVVPLALLARRQLVHFDLRNEEGHAVPLLTAEQNALIDRELLFWLLAEELDHQDVDEATRTAVFEAADPLIEAVLRAGAPAGAVERIEREHGIGPLTDFRDMVTTLSKRFVLWAVTHGVDRRRVLKFAYDEWLRHRAGFVHFYEAPGCVEAGSYHVEIAVPEDLRARTTVLEDGKGTVLASGRRDSDRPALYFSADPAQAPEGTGVTVAYGAERGRFLVPAAIVATVITLLVALPRVLADLEALAGSAGPAVGLVLSTSAVFSALVLRTDEHELLRLMLGPFRLCLVASTLAALFATAVLGFRADAWLLDAGWALAALVSAVAATILIREAVRAPSMGAPAER